ncbi:MAG TPA: hypothetical protein DDY49_11375, partial [Paenibacillaceae bacterium]|nr:hypothetical protein [Paenibacillaceae bacterium]
MHYFAENLKMELRLYRRGIWVWLILTLLLIYLFTGYYIFVESSFSVGQLLQSSTYILMAGSLFGLVLGVISAQRERKVKFEEVLISLPGDWARPFTKIFAWGIIVFILCFFSCAEVIFFYILSKSQLLLFWKET